MIQKSEIGALINVLSFSHPHIESLRKENLWGLPESRSNRLRWEKLSIGCPIFLYGNYLEQDGVWILGEIVEKEYNKSPVKYWSSNPTGYPLQFRVKFIKPKSLDNLNEITPVKRDELITLFGIKILRAKSFSIVTFGDPDKQGITYPISEFYSLKNHFLSLNIEKVHKGEKPDHEKVKEMLYQMGLIQGKFPEKEYLIDSKKLDVVWKRTDKSVPYIVFEVQFRGNLYEALIKLKHAYDLWNSIPVLITDKKQITEAKKWINGSFHEIKDIFRIITWADLNNLYNKKMAYKELEKKLRIV